MRTALTLLIVLSDLGIEPNMKSLFLFFACPLRRSFPFSEGIMRFLICLAKKARAKARRSFWSPETKNTERRKACPCWRKSFPKSTVFIAKFFLLGIRGKHIDPNNQAGVRGWDHLKSADLMLTGTRFRRPTAEDAKHVTEFLNAGKPVIGIRTATHAFTGGGSFGGKISYGAFGPLIMGEGWVSHHGRHKVEGARGVIEAKNAKHPILNGVKDVFGPSDAYGIRRLTDKDTILLRGAVTETLIQSPKTPRARRTIPCKPLAWLHPYEAPNGKGGTTFCTTMGLVDLVSEDLRRLVVNACYHLTGLDARKSRTWPRRSLLSFLLRLYSGQRVLAWSGHAAGRLWFGQDAQRSRAQGFAQVALA